MTEGDSETMGYQWALSEATLQITPERKGPPSRSEV